MSTLFPDTTPEAERVLIELLRRASIERKLEMLDQMNRTARDLAMMGLRARHPNATDAQLQRHMADLLLGPELAARAYGPLPPAESTPPAEAEQQWEEARKEAEARTWRLT